MLTTEEKVESLSKAAPGSGEAGGAVFRSVGFPLGSSLPRAEAAEDATGLLKTLAADKEQTKKAAADQAEKVRELKEHIMMLEALGDEMLEAAALNAKTHAEKLRESANKAHANKRAAWKATAEASKRRTGLLLRSLRSLCNAEMRRGLCSWVQRAAELTLLRRGVAHLRCRDHTSTSERGEQLFCCKAAQTIRSL